MDFFELAKKLNIPEDAALRLRLVPEAKPYLEGLIGEEYEKYAAELHDALGEDEGGYKMLSAMLEAALISYVEYVRRGIPEEIYLSTMGCFPRFVREHMESFGKYGFDRWWWTGRQTSLRLFRIGTLEYELGANDADKWISVHIPSDADLSDDAVDNSLISARAFLKKYFPDYGSAEFHCHSWLLSPALGELLPATSRINRFRSRFELLGLEENDDGFKLWVFKDQSLPIEALPENTSLQRAMKAHLLRGGKVGAGRGIIRKS